VASEARRVYVIALIEKIIRSGEHTRTVTVYFRKMNTYTHIESMAQFEAMRCITCGDPLSNKYELYLAMREAVIARTPSDVIVHADKKYVHPSPNEDLTIIFDQLNLPRLCCRMRIANAVPASTLK